MNLLEWDEIARNGLAAEIALRTFTVKEHYTHGEHLFIPVQITKYTDGFEIWDVIYNGNILGTFLDVTYEHWDMMPKTEEDAWEHLKPILEIIK